MKALVTGSSGFVGGHLVRHLLQLGAEVTCLVRAESDPQALAALPAARVCGDYLDTESLCRAVRGMDMVFHAGAVLAAADWPCFEKANVAGTANLLEACARAAPNLRRFVLVSSIAAAGPARDRRPLRETDDCRPVSLYGRSKHLAEQAAAAFSRRLPIVVIRPANVLGVGQRELLSVMKLLRRRIVPLIGRREKQTSICFVQDLVRALVLAAERERAVGKTYFVAAAEAYSWREIMARLLLEMDRSFVVKIPHPLLMGLAGACEVLAGMAGANPPVSRGDLRSARDNYWLCDAGLIRAELGFRAEVEFAAGIREIVRAFRAGA